MPKHGTATLPGTMRLKKRGAISRVFQAGNGTRVGQIVVKYGTSAAETSELRTAFVVRKSAGNAVRRNRLRRLMREAYRIQRAAIERKLPAGLSLHVVLLWNGTPDQALRPRFDSIREDIDAALRRVVRRLARTSETEEKSHAGSE